MQLTDEDLRIMRQALNECTNGVHDLADDNEFATRIGASRAEAQAVLAKFHEPEYRIALRPDSPDNPELMDDIVVKDVKMFRAEQMSAGEWWVCCYLDNNADEALTFQVSARCRPRRIDWVVTEYPLGEHVYE